MLCIKKLGGDPFFFNTVDKFNSINHFIQYFIVRKALPSSLSTPTQLKCHGHNHRGGKAPSHFGGAQSDRCKG